MEWIFCYYIFIKKEWLDRLIFNNLEIGCFKFKEYIDMNLEKNVENWFELVKFFDLYIVLFFFFKVILWSIFVRNFDFVCFYFVKKFLFYSIINLYEIDWLLIGMCYDLIFYFFMFFIKMGIYNKL